MSHFIREVLAAKKIATDTDKAHEAITKKHPRFAVYFIKQCCWF